MNVSMVSTGMVIAGAAIAVLVAALIAFVAVARLPLERRVRFARFLGNAFLIVIVAATVLGMVAQYFR